MLGGPISASAVVLLNHSCIFEVSMLYVDVEDSPACAVSLCFLPHRLSASPLFPFPPFLAPPPLHPPRLRFGQVAQASRRSVKVLPPRSSLFTHELV